MFVQSLFFHLPEIEVLVLCKINAQAFPTFFMKRNEREDSTRHHECCRSLKSVHRLYTKISGKIVMLFLLVA